MEIHIRQGKLFKISSLVAKNFFCQFDETCSMEVMPKIEMTEDMIEEARKTEMEMVRKGVNAQNKLVSMSVDAQLELAIQGAKTQSQLAK